MNTDIVPQTAPPQPVSDVKQPPAEVPSANAAPKQEPAKAPKPEKPAKPTTPKTDGGVGMAIVATVVIVLGLAALATYAYLKSR